MEFFYFRTFFKNLWRKLTSIEVRQECRVLYVKTDIHFWSRITPFFLQRKRRAVHFWRNIEARSCSRCCSTKAISVSYSEYVFIAFRIQHAMRMPPLCHLCPLRLYNIFPHYLTNGTIFGKRLLNIKCVFWFSVQLLSETFLIVRRNERDMIKYVYWGFM